jgi:hypothetical protein
LFFLNRHDANFEVLKESSVLPKPRRCSTRPPFVFNRLFLHDAAFSLIPLILVWSNAFLVGMGWTHRGKRTSRQSDMSRAAGYLRLLTCALHSQPRHQLAAAVIAAVFGPRSVLSPSR